MAAAFVAVFALTVLAAYVLARRFARRFVDPIGELAGAVRELGEGHWQVHRLGAVADRPDEIGTLAKAFQRMSFQLQELFGRLEQRVEELNSTRQALEVSEEHYKQLYQRGRWWT